MTPTSNTKACFTEFIGQEVVGVLFGGLRGYGNDTKTLIFGDGRGLTINSNGAYWVTSASAVADAVRFDLANRPRAAAHKREMRRAA